jgi:hypothetical protein
MALTQTLPTAVAARPMPNASIRSPKQTRVLPSRRPLTRAHPYKPLKKLPPDRCFDPNLSLDGPRAVPGLPPVSSAASGCPCAMHGDSSIVHAVMGRESQGTGIRSITSVGTRCAVGVVAPRAPGRDLRNCGSRLPSERRSLAGCSLASRAAASPPEGPPCWWRCLDCDARWNAGFSFGGRTADRCVFGARLSRRSGDARVARDDRPVVVRAGPRGAAPRARTMPAYGASTTTSPGTHPQRRSTVEHGSHQRETR